MKRCLPIVLAVSLLLLSGCGTTASNEQTAATGETETTVTTKAPLKMEECYASYAHANDTYYFQVTDCEGTIILEKGDLPRPVSFEELTDDVLVVQGQAGVGIGARWAIFCNIRTGYVSETRMFYLGAWKERAAFVDYRTDKYHVFVTGTMDSNIYHEVYTLDDLAKAEGTEPVSDFEMSKDGVLSVTYPTKDGEKTIKIDMNAK